MELFGFYGVTMLALFMIPSLMIMFLFFILKKSDASPSNLPPGKMGFPIIGETFQFLSAARKGCPFTFISERMTKYSSQVFKTCILGQPTVVVAGAAGNKFLFTNENKLFTLWFPESVNKIIYPTGRTSAGEKSKKMRAFLPEILKPEALQQYIGVMDSVARTNLEAEWEGKQQVKVFPLAKKYTLMVAFKVFLSVENEKQLSRLVKCFDLLVNGLFSMPINFPGTSFYRGVKASKVIRKELMAIIKQRKIDLAENKVSSAQDILSRMLVTTDEDGEYMSEMEVVDNILALLTGGIDTASSVISFIVKCLAEFPHAYDEILKEQMKILRSKEDQEQLLNWFDIQNMKYSWNVVREAMRMAPVIGNFWEAIKDFSFAGFTIPKGWKLYRCLETAHMNPDYFPEPEKFDPTRFEGKGPAPYTFAPFGGGPRICPGKDYARLLILVFMHNLVKRFRWEKLIPDEKITVNPLPFPAEGLPVRLFPMGV